MELTAQNAPPLNDSTYHMLRCVVAVACADHVIQKQEIIFLRALLAHFKKHYQVTPAQIAQLKQDLKDFQPIDSLLPRVTDKNDREQLILFAGLLAQADGVMHPWEETILEKIRGYCEGTVANDTAAPAGVPVPPAPTPEPAATPAPGEAPHPVPDRTSSHPPTSITPPARVNVEAFMNEVRDVVKQEYYKQALTTSGVENKTTRVAVVDAFAEKSNIVPHTDSYEVLNETPRLSKAVRRSLVPEERLLGKGRFHWIYTFNSFVMAGLLVGLSGPARSLAASWGHDMQEYLTMPGHDWMGAQNAAKLYHYFGSPQWTLLPAAILYFAGILLFLWRLLVQWTTEIVITDSRLVAKQGIFKVKTFKVDISNLGQIDVNQSMIGNWLNYGTIHVYTRNWSGKGSQMEAEGIYLPPLADPHAFSTLVDRARRMWRTRSV